MNKVFMGTFITLLSLVIIGGLGWLIYNDVKGDKTTTNKPQQEQEVDYKDKYTKLYAEYTALNSRVVQLENDLNDSKANYATVNASLTSIKSDIIALNTALKEDSDLPTLENKEAQELAVAMKLYIDGKLKELQKQVDALNALVESLQSGTVSVEGWTILKVDKDIVNLFVENTETEAQNTIEGHFSNSNVGKYTGSKIKEMLTNCCVTGINVYDCVWLKKDSGSALMLSLGSKYYNNLKANKDNVKLSFNGDYVDVSTLEDSVYYFIKIALSGITLTVSGGIDNAIIEIGIYKEGSILW